MEHAYVGVRHIRDIFSQSHSDINIDSQDDILKVSAALNPISVRYLGGFFFWWQNIWRNLAITPISWRIGKCSRRETGGRRLAAKHVETPEIRQVFSFCEEAANAYLNIWVRAFQRHCSLQERSHRLLSYYRDNDGATARGPTCNATHTLCWNVLCSWRMSPVSPTIHCLLT